MATSAIQRVASRVAPTGAASSRRALDQSTGEPSLKRHRTLRSFSRSWSGMVGVTLMLLLVIVALAAPIIAPEGFSEQDLGNRLQPPAWMEGGSMDHPLGTDPLGRNILSRMVWAARVSLGIAAVSVLIAMSFGVLMGLLSGYYEGRLDAVIMRIVDVQLAFPYLLLAIAVMALLRPSLTNLVIVLALPGWTIYARMVRASILSWKQHEFVQAAVASGASDRRVIFRHLAPNVLGSVLVMSTFAFAEIIIAEASLSFLGVGVQPPMPSWGAMLSQGREYLTTMWWLGVFPGIAIVLAVLGANLFGDGLRDAMDPRVKSV